MIEKLKYISGIIAVLIIIVFITYYLSTEDNELNHVSWIECGSVYTNEQSFVVISFNRGLRFDKITSGCGCFFVVEYRLDETWHPIDKFSEIISERIDAIKVRVYVTAKLGRIANQSVYLQNMGNIIRTFIINFQVRSRSFLCSDYSIYFARQVVGTQVSASVYLYNARSDNFRCVKWASSDPDVRLEFVEEAPEARSIDEYTPLGMLKVHCTAYDPRVIDSVITLEDEFGQQSTIQVKGEYEALVRVAPAQAMLPLHSNSGKVYSSKHVIRSCIEKSFNVELCMFLHVVTCYFYLMQTNAVQH